MGPFRPQRPGGLIPSSSSDSPNFFFLPVLERANGAAELMFPLDTLFLG